MITLILIIVLVVVLVNRNKKSSRARSLENNDPESYASEVDHINHEILVELDKPEPNLARMQNLRARMRRLEAEETGGVARSAIIGNTESKPVGGLAVALYVGSLLILAGVGGLVLSGLNAVGLPLLILATVAFYAGGMMMRNNEKLKMVSHVFVGTGLAMVPFVGILVQNITQADPRAVWLVTSIIGTPLLFLATYVMNNKIFSFFAIAGLVSVSCSLSATLGLGLVWYFALIMGLGIILDLIKNSQLGDKLGVMGDAIRMSGEWMPLATLMASMLAMAGLSEVDYLILLSITALQLVLNMWRKPNVLWESILRLTLSIWVVLLIHILVPTNLALGVGIALATTGELACSFLMAQRKVGDKSERMAIELLWVGAELISYLVAGALISNFSAPGIWTAMTVALVVDAVIVVAARFYFGLPEWYYGLIPVGVVLPIMIANMMGLTGETFRMLLIVFYAIGMFLMEGLGWGIKEPQKGDVLMVSSIMVFGVAIFVAKPVALVAAVALTLAAIGFGVRGVSLNNRSLTEVGIYVATMAVITLLADFLLPEQGKLMGVLAAHVVLIGLTLTSLLYDNKTVRGRLAVGVVALLVIMGGLALGGDAWIMVMFMIEATLILVAGLALKLRSLWIAGAVALGLAVMWFTRGLSFVWPVLLGLGLIATVILMIVRNDRKKLK